VAGLNEGDSLAYRIATPLDAIYAIDMALKADDVRLAACDGQPSETSFGACLLAGSRPACRAACGAFAAAVQFVAENPTAYRRPGARHRKSVTDSPLGCSRPRATPHWPGRPGRCRCRQHWPVGTVGTHYCPPGSGGQGNSPKVRTQKHRQRGSVGFRRRLAWRPRQRPRHPTAQLGELFFRCPSRGRNPPGGRHAATGVLKARQPGSECARHSLLGVRASGHPGWHRPGPSPRIPEPVQF
jgi:hypothetical protein